jgi:hypothetical protein
MPDNSEPRLIPAKDRLKPGRYPVWLEPTVPYRVEEWGKSAVYIVPKGWKPLPDGSNMPTVRRRGHPGLGSLATYIGKNALAPRPSFAPAEYRVVKEGFAYTEREAQARANAWVRARLLESVGKARRRAKAARAAGVLTSGSEPASPATSASHAGRRGT